MIRKIKPAQKLLADKAYDSAALRLWLNKRGTKPVIPNKSNRKQPFSFDRKSYKQRHLIENAFCRLKDFRRIATRYDRLARNFMASIYLVAAIVWWIYLVVTLISTKFKKVMEFPHIQINRARLADGIDRYIRVRLFGQPVDPFADENWRVIWGTP